MSGNLGHEFSVGIMKCSFFSEACLECGGIGRPECLLILRFSLFLYNSKRLPMASFFSFNIMSISPMRAVISPRLLSLVPHTFNSFSFFWFSSRQCSNQVALSSLSVLPTLDGPIFLGGDFGRVGVPLHSAFLM